MKRALVCSVLVAIIFSCFAWAGGPSVVLFKKVYRWKITVPFTVDSGTLGALDSDEAIALIQECFKRWQDIPEASIAFQYGGQLSVDITESNFTSFFSNQIRPENPVVFDSDGTIIDSLYGEGSSDFILGFAGVRYIRPSDQSIASGWVVLNGVWAGVPEFKRAAIHEIGHFIGLAHTQAGWDQALSDDLSDNADIPMMYPFLMDGMSLDFKRDDIAWAYYLYPETSYVTRTGRLGGWVHRADGSGVSFANVVAVKIVNGQPTTEIVAGYSDDIDQDGHGFFELPGLSPGAYHVYVEPLSEDSLAADDWGGVFTDFPRDYYNGGFESASDNVDQKSTVNVVGGGALFNINFVTNEKTPPPPGPNLQFYSAAACNETLVISNVKGATSSAGGFGPADKVYITFALANSGSLSATNGFDVKVLVDGETKGTWQVDVPFAAGAMWEKRDFELENLSRGKHTVRLVADTGNTVAEMNEDDNAFEKQVSLANEPPVVDAGANQLVAKGQAVTLAATASDPDGDTMTFDWSQTSGPTVTLADRTKTTTTFTAPALEATTDFVFQFTARDKWGAEASDEVVITVKENKPPVVVAGGTIAAKPGELATLAARVSDLDGDVLSIRWSQVSGSTVTLKTASSAVASFLIPTGTADGNLVFKVAVSDKTVTVEKEVTVQVSNTVYNTLAFPYSLQGGGADFSNTFVGVAILNACTAENEIEAARTNTEGQVTWSDKLPGKMSAWGQSSFLTTDIGNASPDGCALKLRGSSGPTRGFFMVGDYTLERLDGVGGEAKPAKKIFFPVAGLDGKESILLFVRNDLSIAAMVSLKLTSPAGQVVRQKVLDIPANSMNPVCVKSIWPDLSGSGAAFIQASSSTPISGFELVISDVGVAGAAAQVAEEAKRLYVPHFFIDNQGGSTELRLLTTTSTAAKVTVNAFDDQHHLIFSTLAEIKSNQMAVVDLQKQLSDAGIPLPASGLLTGYLELEVKSAQPLPGAPGPSVAGVARFKTSGGAFSILPAMSKGGTDTLFLHVAQSLEQRLFTGFAIYNPNLEAAQLTIEAFSTSGQKTAGTTISIPAGYRVVDLLSSTTFFGQAFSQLGGHVRVKSNLPVVTFALFGDLRSRYLAAIEGQSAN